MLGTEVYERVLKKGETIYLIDDYDGYAVMISPEYFSKVKGKAKGYKEVIVDYDNCRTEETIGCGREATKEEYDNY